MRCGCRRIFRSQFKPPLTDSPPPFHAIRARFRGYAWCMAVPLTQQSLPMSQVPEIDELMACVKSIKKEVS